MRSCSSMAPSLRDGINSAKSVLTWILALIVMLVFTPSLAQGPEQRTPEQQRQLDALTTQLQLQQTQRDLQQMQIQRELDQQRLQMDIRQQQQRLQQKAEQQQMQLEIDRMRR